MSSETLDDNERRREKPEVTPQPHKPEVDPNRRTPDKIDPPKEPSPEVGLRAAALRILDPLPIVGDGKYHFTSCQPRTCNG
jgi:hypothetical protein